MSSRNKFMVYLIIGVLCIVAIAVLAVILKPVFEKGGVLVVLLAIGGFILGLFGWKKRKKTEVTEPRRADIAPEKFPRSETPSMTTPTSYNAPQSQIHEETGNCPKRIDPPERIRQDKENREQYPDRRIR